MISKSHFQSSALIVLFLCWAVASSAAEKPQKTGTDSSREAYFSPNGHIKARLVEEIDNAKNSMDIAVFNITSLSIKSALKKARKRGVQIRLVTDQGESEDLHSVTGSLLEDGFAIKFVKGKGQNGLMHHKFAIFDHKLLLTGSYNWTETAEHDSYENAVFLRNKSLIKEFEKEFDLLWAKA